MEHHVLGFIGIVFMLIIAVVGATLSLALYIGGIHGVGNSEDAISDIMSTLMTFLGLIMTYGMCSLIMVGFGFDEKRMGAEYFTGVSVGITLVIGGIYGAKLFIESLFDYHNYHPIHDPFAPFDYRKMYVGLGMSLAGSFGILCVLKGFRII